MDNFDKNASKVITAVSSEGDHIQQIPSDLYVDHEKHPLLQGIRVGSCGFFPRSDEHYLKREAISETVLIYCTEGPFSLAWSQL